MPIESRIIKASALAGLTDLLIGLFMVYLGIADWWYNSFHLFGMLGFGMIFYALWHYILLKYDNKRNKNG